jgi:hypothetical protein
MARTAVEILEEFAAPDDVPMQDVKKKLLAFIAEMERLHAPVELYPDDRNRYCAVCASADFGSSRWPCGTVRAVRKFLRASVAADANLKRARKRP